MLLEGVLALNTGRSYRSSCENHSNLPQVFSVDFGLCLSAVSFRGHRVVTVVAVHQTPVFQRTAVRFYPSTCSRKHQHMKHTQRKRIRTMDFFRKKDSFMLSSMIHGGVYNSPSQ